MTMFLREAEVWMEIARRLATYPNSTEILGLCWEVKKMFLKGQIHDILRQTMDRRIKAHLRVFSSWSNYMDDPGVRDARILAALFLSYEAADEEHTTDVVLQYYS